MQKWMLLAVLLAACGPSNKAEIKKTAINTEDARLSGFLEDIQANDCKPLCSVDERDVDVDAELLQDEALLIEVDGSVCADTVVRTVIDFDATFFEFAPTCELDGQQASAVVSDEVFDVWEYGGDVPIKLAEAMSDGDLQQSRNMTVRQAYAGTEYTPDRLRVVERRARVCCTGQPATSMSIRLANESNPDYPQGLDFLWIFVE